MLNKMFNRNVWRVAPVVVFIAILGVLLMGLNKEPKKSTRTNVEEQYFPEFNLKDVREHNVSVGLGTLKGKPFVVHIWASWCGTCLKEHPSWVKYHKKHNFRLVGILYRDNPSKVKKLLSQKGDPYDYLLSDPSGSLGLDLGIAGIPATFVVDSDGKIRYTHFGEVSSKQFEKSILPLLSSGKK